MTGGGYEVSQNNQCVDLTMGVLYVASGEKYLLEAVQSATSLKKYMPQMPVMLFTDDPKWASADLGLFTNIRRMPYVSRSVMDKIFPLLETPFEKTLFLDTDTYICDSIQDIFDALGNFDICAAHAPYRFQYPVPCPDTFPELNTGVIGFKKTNEVMRCLKEWIRIFENQKISNLKPHHDQHSFRQAVYESNIRFLVLPPEYNYRTICPGFAGKGCKVKIIHGRNMDMDKVSKRINKYSGNRVTVDHRYRCFTNEVIFLRSSFYAFIRPTYESLVELLKRFPRLYNMLRSLIKK